MLNRHARHAAPKVRRKRKWLALGIVVPLLMGGAAFAFFDLNQATSHINVATTPSFTVVIGQPVGPPLSPGIGEENVAFTVINQLSHSQTIDAETFAVTTDPAGGVFDTNSNAFVDSCKASWFDITDSGDGGVVLPTIVQPGQSLTNGSIGVKLTETGTDETACESLSPQVSVTLS